MSLTVKQVEFDLFACDSFAKVFARLPDNTDIPVTNWEQNYLFTTDRKAESITAAVAYSKILKRDDSTACVKIGPNLYAIRYITEEDPGPDGDSVYGVKVILHLEPEPHIVTRRFSVRISDREIASFLAEQSKEVSS